MQIPDELPFTPSATTQTEMALAAANVANAQQAGEKEQDIFVFSEFTAGQYKEYDVIKENQHGVKQHRIMGIDREKIYNMLPKQQTGFLGAKAAKKPARLIEDLEKVEFNEADPTEFILHFRENNAENSKYRYESKNGQTREIVAKLEFLMQLNKRQKR